MLVYNKHSLVNLSLGFNFSYISFMLAVKHHKYLASLQFWILAGRSTAI